MVIFICLLWAADNIQSFRFIATSGVLNVVLTDTLPYNLMLFIRYRRARAENQYLHCIPDCASGWKLL